MGSKGESVVWLKGRARSPRQLRRLRNAHSDTLTIVDSLPQLCTLCMSVIDGPAAWEHSSSVSQRCLSETSLLNPPHSPALPVRLADLLELIKVVEQLLPRLSVLRK